MTDETNLHGSKYWEYYRRAQNMSRSELTYEIGRAEHSVVIARRMLSGAEGRLNGLVDWRTDFQEHIETCTLCAEAYREMETS